MIAEGFIQSTTSPLTRANVAHWANNVAEMNAEDRIIQNAWRRHGGYTWFVGDEEACDEVVGGNEEGEEGAV